jgi:DNA repair protein SbcC/Rad50
MQTAALMRDTVKARLDLWKSDEQELRKIRTRHLGDKPHNEPDVELERRLSTVEDVAEVLRSSEIPIELAETDEFSTHASQLSAFAGTVARIQEAYKQVEEKDALEKSILTDLEKTQKEIEKLELVDKRATTAIALLDSLMGSNFKDEYLKKVRTSHREKIATIFLQIHAPHEFKDLRLNGQVLLERQTGVMAKVNTISTGQRAALALSIFLGLNSSVAGRAPWILFDDPIVHVDDLNVVSFLDMLRDLVLQGDRQIFFATANSRVGDLFARKFDFLGENFKDFRFQR